MPTVLGNHAISLEKQCEAFWALYKYKHCDHAVYYSGKDLKRCLPINLYGDEGRGPKRAQFLEMSVETAFGVFDHKDPCCGCAAQVGKMPAGAFPQCAAETISGSLASVAAGLTTNLKAHSYITKRLIFGPPSYIYKEHDEILQEHLRLLSEDMVQLYDMGLTIGASTWYAVVIGVKGDMKFHAETCCHFDRYHANLGKSDRMMCPLCLAGGPCAFEEVDHTWVDKNYWCEPPMGGWWFSLVGQDPFWSKRPPRVDVQVGPFSPKQGWADEGLSREPHSHYVPSWIVWLRGFWK